MELSSRNHFPFLLYALNPVIGAKLSYAAPPVVRAVQDNDGERFSYVRAVGNELVQL
jgi:hypothetical protein